MSLFPRRVVYAGHHRSVRVEATFGHPDGAAGDLQSQVLNSATEGRDQEIQHCVRMCSRLHNYPSPIWHSTPPPQAGPRSPLLLSYVQGSVSWLLGTGRWFNLTICYVRQVSPGRTFFQRLPIFSLWVVNICPCSPGWLLCFRVKDISSSVSPSND